MEKIEIECDNNNLAKSRSGVVTITDSSGMTASVSVTQEASVGGAVTDPDFGNTYTLTVQNSMMVNIAMTFNGVSQTLSAGGSLTRTYTEGTEVAWTAEADGYDSAGGTLTMDEDKVLTITLTQK